MTDLATQAIRHADRVEKHYRSGQAYTQDVPPTLDHSLGLAIFYALMSIASELESIGDRMQP